MDGLRELVPLRSCVDTDVEVKTRERGVVFDSSLNVAVAVTVDAVAVAG